MRPPPEPGDAAWRRAERRRLIAARLAMAQPERAAASRAIEAALEARLSLGSPGIVGGYWPIQGEFDVLPYLRRRLGSGGAVALPVAGSRGEALRYRPWTSETAMEAGWWDIQHPAEGANVTPDVLLIPLVGFDAARHRLGYGGGFFDRTLGAWRPRPLAVGLGFELGRLESIVPKEHDQPMDVVITEGGVL
jgi:5-formyltetrahydrofolate cyclo-ligase